MLVVSSTMFPALSFTCIIISSTLSVYSLLFSSCHVKPPSKLYPSIPDISSLAIISTRTASIVFSSVDLFMLSITGNSLSNFTSFSVTSDLLPLLTYVYASTLCAPFCFIVFSSTLFVVSNLSPSIVYTVFSNSSSSVVILTFISSLYHSLFSVPSTSIVGSFGAPTSPISSSSNTMYLINLSISIKFTSVSPFISLDTNSIPAISFPSNPAKWFIICTTSTIFAFPS